MATLIRRVPDNAHRQWLREGTIVWVHTLGTVGIPMALWWWACGLLFDHWMVGHHALAAFGVLGVLCATDTPLRLTQIVAARTAREGRVGWGAVGSDVRMFWSDPDNRARARLLWRATVMRSLIGIAVVLAASLVLDWVCGPGPSGHSIVAPGGGAIANALWAAAAGLDAIIAWWGIGLGPLLAVLLGVVIPMAVQQSDNFMALTAPVVADGWDVSDAVRLNQIMHLINIKPLWNCGKWLVLVWLLCVLVPVGWFVLVPWWTCVLTRAVDDMMGPRPLKALQKAPARRAIVLRPHAVGLRSA